MDREGPPNKARTLLPHPVVFPPEGGACKGQPTEWWYPEYPRTMSAHDKTTLLNLVDHAKRICFKCLVREECLTYSLNHEPFGVWGGFDERERLMLAMKQGIIPTRTRAGQKLSSLMSRPRTVSRGVPTHR